MTPLVSTIIPAYNAGRWIEAAVRSALDQGVEQEVIVIDDGSTDGTAKLARRCGSPVVVYSQRNAGVSQARNRGLELARGQYIAFLDADDVWLPGKLAAQLEAFERFPQAGTVICDEAHVTDAGDVVHPSFMATRSFAADLPCDTAILEKALTWLVTESFFPTSSVLTRARVARAAGLFDTSLSIVEDRDYWIRLALQAPVAIVPRVLLRYRTDPGSGQSQLHRRKWAWSVKLVLDRHRDALLPRIRAEGSPARRTLGRQYLSAARTCWYADQLDEARTLLLDAAKMGCFDFPKLIASQLGVVPLARALRRLVA